MFSPAVGSFRIDRYRRDLKVLDPAVNQEPSRLVDEMLTLAYEGALLWEFPLAKITRSPGGSKVLIHGPWRPEACGAVLLRWYDAGWLLCAASAGGWDSSGAFVPVKYEGDWVRRATVMRSFYILEPADARNVLADFPTWASGPDQNIQVEVKQEHLEHKVAEWLGLLDDLPQHLVYG